MNNFNHSSFRIFRGLMLVIGPVLFMFATWQYIQGNVPLLALVIITSIVLYSTIENVWALRSSKGMKISSKAEALSSSFRSGVSVFFSWIWNMFNGVVIVFMGYVLMLYSTSDLPWSISVHGMWVMATLLFVFTSHVVIAVLNMQKTWLMSSTDDLPTEMKKRMQEYRVRAESGSL